jgi:hypothetical protein
MQKIIIAFFKLRAEGTLRRRRRFFRGTRAACMVCKKKFLGAYPGDNICGACRTDIDARAAALHNGVGQPS